LLLEEEDALFLKQLGLSISQVKVYFALLCLGKSNGKTIWQHSGVSRQDLYRILLELQQIGFVEKRLDAKPAEYEAIPLHEGLSSLLSQKIQEYKEIEQKATNLLEKLTSIETQPTEETQFRFIYPKASLQKRKQCIKFAQKNIDIITSWTRFLQLTSTQIKDLTDAINRNVTYRIIINNTQQDKKATPKIIQNFIKKPLCKIKFLNSNSTDTSLSIYDEKQILIEIDPKKPHYLDSALLWSNNTSITTISQHYFNSLRQETTK
jgi:sugar-specific transcriptional regulator TrmB